MAIKKISANLLGSNAVLAANIAGGAISAADIADNSITAAKISASTSPTLGGLTLKDDFGSGVALTLDRTESSIVDTLFYLGVTSSVSAANDRMWFGTSTTDLTITDDGTIGIGTDNPETNLHIEDSSSYSIIRLVASSTSNAGIDFGDSSDRDIGRVRYYNNGDYMVFHTNAAERVRIDSSGNVGIGETSPTLGLSVGNAKGVLFGPSTGASTYISPDHENTINGGYGLDTDTGDLWVNYRGYQNGTSRFRDFRVGDGKEGLVAFFDGSSGNVGIGQSSPAELLHVYGTDPVIRVSDDGTTGFPSLQLLQQNASTEGTELLYDSSTGHTHLNTLFTTGNIRFGTANGSLGSTGNVRMTIDHTGKVGIGTSTIPHNSVGYAKFAMEGSDTNAGGPHIQYTTTSDDYPLFQQLNWTHDNISLNFDAYYDGTWKSSHATSNFQIYKSSNTFRIGYESGVAQGSGITWSDALTVQNDGEIKIGQSNKSTDRLIFAGNTNISAPSTSNHDQGTRLTLYDATANSWYAIGIESNHMWFNADEGAFKFYTRATQKVHFDVSEPMPRVRVGPTASNAMRLGSITAVFPYSGPTLIAATPGASLTIHSSTNTTGGWSSLANSTNFPDYLRNTATFNTINTSQQANIIVYLNVATKVYLVRDPGWNSVSLTDWVQISDNYVYGSGTSNVYVRYLPAGTHSLDNDSALYFFEAPIGP